MAVHIETIIEGADMPDHMKSMTSSIGTIGEPQPASFRRLKGVHKAIIRDQSELSSFVREYMNAAEYLNGEYTRVQHRGLIDTQFLKDEIRRGSVWVDAIESLVELDEQHVFVYLSKNTDSRKVDVRDEEKIYDNLQVLKTTPFKSYQQTISEVEEKGYQVELLTAEERFGTQSKDTIQQLFRLYERFGWNIDDIQALCESVDNTICVVKYNNQIVSAGIAERATLPLGDKEIYITEITEAATDTLHTNKGLYAAVSCKLLQYLATTNVDLVFGECNALSYGVLKVAAAQGRKSALETMQEYGLPRSGQLEQQVPIKDPTGIQYSEYNNLMPMSLTRARLLLLVGY